MFKDKRGLELSFAMIFSIIVIIATLGVAAYVLSNFLSLKSCSEVGIFYQGLDEFVQKAWREDIARRTFESPLPQGIESVCFGNISRGSGAEYEKLKRYGRNGENMFFYPPEKSCSVPAFKVDNIYVGEWKCFNEFNGKVSIRLEKEIFGNFVFLCKSGEECGTGQIFGNTPGSSLGSTNNRPVRTEISETWCGRAQEDNLCDGLNIASNNQFYKQGCCQTYGKCC